MPLLVEAKCVTEMGLTRVISYVKVGHVVIISSVLAQTRPQGQGPQINSQRGLARRFSVGADDMHRDVITTKVTSARVINVVTSCAINLFMVTLWHGTREPIPDARVVIRSGRNVRQPLHSCITIRRRVIITYNVLLLVSRLLMGKDLVVRTNQRTGVGLLTPVKQRHCHDTKASGGLAIRAPVVNTRTDHRHPRSVIKHGAMAILCVSLRAIEVRISVKGRIMGRLSALEVSQRNVAQQVAYLPLTSAIRRGLVLVTRAPLRVISIDVVHAHVTRVSCDNIRAITHVLVVATHARQTDVNALSPAQRVLLQGPVFTNGIMYLALINVRHTSVRDRARAIH